MSYPRSYPQSIFHPSSDDDDLDLDIPNCPSETSAAMEIDLELADEFVPSAPEPSGPFAFIKKRIKTQYWSSGEPIEKMDYENLNAKTPKILKIFVSSSDDDEPLEDVKFSEKSIIDHEGQNRKIFKGKGKGKGKKSGK